MSVLALNYCYALELFFPCPEWSVEIRGDDTVGKKTVRMFVNIQRLLNKSRTIEVTDLKILGTELQSSPYNVLSC